MARWLKHHEGALYRVVIENDGNRPTYYGPYTLLRTARGVKSNFLNSYWNKRRRVPNTGYIEETQTQWYRVDD